MFYLTSAGSFNHNDEYVEAVGVSDWQNTDITTVPYASEAEAQASTTGETVESMPKMLADESFGKRLVRYIKEHPGAGRGHDVAGWWQPEL